jgi:hypothetical protein
MNKVNKTKIKGQSIGRNNFERSKSKNRNNKERKLMNGFLNSSSKEGKRLTKCLRKESGKRRN